VTVLKYILLVDDSAVIRAATRHFLDSQPGFSVCGEAIDGLDALEKAQNLNPDLIILDLAMPRMNGLQAARKLRALMNNVPIILFMVRRRYPARRRSRRRHQRRGFKIESRCLANSPQHFVRSRLGRPIFVQALLTAAQFLPQPVIPAPTPFGPRSTSPSLPRAQTI
jgi:CheY-like chemotaxis protein